MTFDELEIDRILDTPTEGEHLEFKSAEREFSFEKLLDYCVALANEGGGLLLLGISDSVPRRVTGTSAYLNPSKTASQLMNKLGFRVNLHVVPHRDGRVLVFEIPSRPIGRPCAIDGRFLMRVGEELRAMTPEQLKRVFDEGNPDFLDRVAMTGLSAEKVLELLDTQSYFELTERPYPGTREETLRRFISEGLILKARDSYSITNLGAVLFAKNLRAFDSLYRKPPRFVIYDGNNKTKTRLDQTGGLGFAVGFSRLIEFVLAQIPSNEFVEKALRKKVTMFPEIAIRELIANALIHQDFEISGASVMIELYTDRIEVSNPGIPSIDTNRFIDEYQSRNERLADILRRARICEEQGSGIDKVINSVEFFQLPAPDFRVSENRTTVVLFAHKEFKDMDRNDRIRACYQHCVLRWVSNQSMSNESLRERFALPSDRAERVSRVIRDTMDAKLIRPEDLAGASKKFARYVPA